MASRGAKEHCSFGFARKKTYGASEKEKKHGVCIGVDSTRSSWNGSSFIFLQALMRADGEDGRIVGT